MDGPGALGQVFHVELGRHNEILAAQPRSSTISVFDSVGQFIREIGRAGRGPGEFSALGRIGWTGDTLWAMDMGRLHLWSSDLEYVRTITPYVVATPAGVGRVIPGPVLNDGSILGIALVFGASGEQPILLLEEDGSVRRVVAHASVDGRVVSLDLTTGPFNAPNPWADHPLWVSAADGQSVIVVDRRVAVAPRNAEYRIVRIDLRGDTVLAAPIEYDPVELSAASRDQAISQVAELVSRAREVTPVEAERQVQAALTPPRYLVPVTEVVAGRDGTIWLRREDVRSDSVYWEVLGSSGERSGWGWLPADLRVSGADSNRVWGTVTNALGVPLVQVYQIQRDG